MIRNGDLGRLKQAELALLWACSVRTVRRRPGNDSLRHGSGQGCYCVWDEGRGRGPLFQVQAVADDDSSDKAPPFRAEAVWPTRMPGI
jgi:hypothetical protein